MNCLVAIPPYAEPVDVVEMKNHLKQELGITEDDALIRAQIVAARDVVETGTGANLLRNQVIVATTFDLYLDNFPAQGCIEFPKVPLVSVESITYVDTSGITQTLSAAAYSVKTSDGRAVLAYGQVWPSTRGWLGDQVVVRFVAGMMAPFTADPAGDALTISGQSFAVGDRMRLLNSGGALPLPLKTQLDYFVIAGSKISTSSGGSAVDITAAGSGTHFAGMNISGFEALRAAVKLLVTHFYRNRGDSNVPPPMAIDALIASQLAR